MNDGTIGRSPTIHVTFDGFTIGVDRIFARSIGHVMNVGKH